MTKPKTGKYSVKPYQCDNCGHEAEHGTNHWGKIYNIKCKGCCFGCFDFQTFTCTETCPTTHDLPEEWKTAKLGDLIE